MEKEEGKGKRKKERKGRGDKRREWEMEAGEKRTGQGREQSKREEEEDGRQRGERGIVELPTEPYFKLGLLCELDLRHLCTIISHFNIQKYSKTSHPLIVP